MDDTQHPEPESGLSFEDFVLAKLPAIEGACAYHTQQAKEHADNALRMDGLKRGLEQLRAEYDALQESPTPEPPLTFPPAAP